MPALLQRCLFICAASLIPLAHGEINYTWEDAFTSSEQQKLKLWIKETVTGVESLVGTLPFTLDIRVHRAGSAGEPVPWANTRRGSTQGVNFHVNPHFSLDEFRRDWTAAHELSHLIIPYLGRSSAWFAEGFASFMQYQVMMAVGVLDAEQADDRYLTRLNRARRNYPYQHTPFPDSTADLRASGRYPTMYWGGAAYFLQVDQHLRDNHDTSLINVLQAYLNCCRRNRGNLDHLVAALDQVSEAKVFSATLQNFRTKPGFPDYQMLE